MDRYIDIPLFLVAVYSSVLSYMYEDHFGLFISQASYMIYPRHFPPYSCRLAYMDLQWFTSLPSVLRTSW
jgi:hypothetical protein